ncbi:MAG: hypothetical protein EA408_11940 [Marinilabiliales bacterium]|nr:MAG: hypothetical protein EA408_11940 [Marinilabiliales bacterium]
MKILLRLALILLFLGVSFAAAVYVEIPYNINTKGVVSPVREWRLDRLPDGTIINTEKNNFTNKIAYFSVLEFQRGDHAEFIVNEDLFTGRTVNKGDTVGYIRSWEEERRLINLTGALEEQEKRLEVSLSGEKQEEINAATERLILAEKEYETQKRLVARMEALHKTGVIADEDWDRALNDYLVKEQNMNIARSVIEVVSTGSKPEEQELIRAMIRNYQRQIGQTQNRIDAFNILAPFSGTIIRQQMTLEDTESIIRVGDMERLTVTLPVELYQLAYIENGNPVVLRVNAGRRTYNARVIGFDNTVQFMDQRQNVFVTAIIEEETERFIPNMLVQAQIICGEVSAWDYVRRMFKLIFEN